MNLVNFYHKAWDKPYGYVVINLDNDPKYGRYWANYTDIYIPKYYLD